MAQRRFLAAADMAQLLRLVNRVTAIDERNAARQHRLALSELCKMCNATMAIAEILPMANDAFLDDVSIVVRPRDRSQDAARLRDIATDVEAPSWLHDPSPGEVLRSERSLYSESRPTDVVAATFIILMRPDKPFDERDRRIVRLLHEQLMPLFAAMIS